MEFYLIGVIHRDKEGAFFLRERLFEIRPHIITLELSKYGLNFRKRYGSFYKKRLSELFEELKEEGKESKEELKERLFSFFDIPYEYEVAKEYGSTFGAKVIPIDMGLFSYNYLKGVKRLIEKKNLEKFLENFDPFGKKKEKLRAKLFFEKGIKTARYTKEMFVRDRFMVKRIERLIKDVKDGRLVHICGWEHLLDPFKLFERLNPRKIFFYDRGYSL